jgi:hypothetical protein
MMIDTIWYITYVTMLISGAIILLSAMLLVNRVSKIRYEHRINSDRLAQVYWIIVMVSTMTFIASWIAMMIVAAINTAIR